MGGVNKAPNADGCVKLGEPDGENVNTKFDVYLAALGGALPTPPRPSDNSGDGCVGTYRYMHNPGGQDVYKFALLTMVEDETKANVKCDGPFTGGGDGVVTLNAPEAGDACYAILTQ